MEDLFNELERKKRCYYATSNIACAVFTFCAIGILILLIGALPENKTMFLIAMIILSTISTISFITMLFSSHRFKILERRLNLTPYRVQIQNEIYVGEIVV